MVLFPAAWLVFPTTWLAARVWLAVAGLAVLPVAGLATLLEAWLAALPPFLTGIFFPL